MNTALIVEPRDMKRIPLILNHFLFTLGSNWKIVFYCGLGLKAKWISIVNKEIEIRELSVNNFKASEYSDFLKSKELWNSLYGDFVLVFQTDAWIMNEPPYTIDYFLSQNKSYIGGNMCYKWSILEFKTPFSNYNGGLSLRKRKDMLYILEQFPPSKTISNIADDTKVEDSPPIGELPEDVYFVKGCYLLNLDLGDTNEHFNHFALHTISYGSAFGVHKPSWFVKQELVKLHPEIQTAYV
jgi:hypothetical protein